MGSCRDALAACQGCRQASDASRIFTALIESALADSPLPRAFAGLAHIPYWQVLDKHVVFVDLARGPKLFSDVGVDETTGPRELPQVAELLAARPEFEPVGLPSQHGLNIFGP